MKKYQVTAVRKDDPTGGARQVWGYSLVEALTWIARHEERHGGRHLYQVTESVNTGEGWCRVGQTFFTTYGVQITEADFATRVRG